MPSRTRRIAYFDCPSGVAGNMLIGACLDAGLSFDWFQSQISRLPLCGYELIFRKKRWKRDPSKQVLGVYFDVSVDDRAQGHSHRSLAEVRKIIRSARLSRPVESRALRIFDVLAKAEAAVHGTSVDCVHFHEVGAVDAIIDVVGAALCLEALKVSEVRGSAVNVGSGRVRAAHGWLDLPAPATREILKRRRIPHYSGYPRFETATPTGVAILGSEADSYRPLPALRHVRHGFGFGSRERSDTPNALHLLLGL